MRVCVQRIMAEPQEETGKEIPQRRCVKGIASLWQSALLEIPRCTFHFGCAFICFELIYTTQHAMMAVLRVLF